MRCWLNEKKHVIFREKKKESKKSDHEHTLKARKLIKNLLRSTSKLDIIIEICYIEALHKRELAFYMRLL